MRPHTTYLSRKKHGVNLAGRSIGIKCDHEIHREPLWKEILLLAVPTFISSVLPVVIDHVLNGGPQQGMQIIPQYLSGVGFPQQPSLSQPPLGLHPQVPPVSPIPPQPLPRQPNEDREVEDFRVFVAQAKTNNKRVV